MYQIIVSEAVFSILKITVLNPNAKMLLFLLPSDEQGPTMEQVDTDTDLGELGQGLPGPLVRWTPVDLVHQDQAVVVQLALGQEPLEFSHLHRRGEDQVKGRSVIP